MLNVVLLNQILKKVIFLNILSVNFKSVHTFYKINALHILWKKYVETNIEPISTGLEE